MQNISKSFIPILVLFSLSACTDRARFAVSSPDSGQEDDAGSEDEFADNNHWTEDVWSGDVGIEQDSQIVDTGIDAVDETEDTPEADEGRDINRDTVVDPVDDVDLPDVEEADFSDDSEIQHGDLIRGETLSTIYYIGEMGFRHTFPNDTVFLSWYENFNTVKDVTDLEVAAIPLRLNVTIKPGFKMVKIQSDPKAYVVDVCEIRWVESEAIATEIYGEDWNQEIVDIPDVYFVDYVIGAPILQASEYDRDAALVATIDDVIACHQ